MIKSIEEFRKFEETIKKIQPLTYIPFSKKYVNLAKENSESLMYLSFCGLKVTDEVLKEIEGIRETTYMNFSEACHYYVNSIFNLSKQRILK